MSAPATTTSQREDAVTIEGQVNHVLRQGYQILEAEQEGGGGSRLAEALRHANVILEVVTVYSRFELEDQLQLLRGHCLRRLGRLRAAHAAYVRAASLYQVDGVRTHHTSTLAAECLAEMRAAPGTSAVYGAASATIVVEEEEWESGKKTRNDPHLSMVVNIGGCGEELPPRDGQGHIVDSATRKPGLRSAKGKSVGGLRNLSN